jgi:hypothetical protein
VEWVVKDLKGFRDLKDLPELMEREDLRVHVVFKDLRGRREYREPKDPEEPKDRLDQKVRLDFKDLHWRFPMQGILVFS